MVADGWKFPGEQLEECSIESHKFGHPENAAKQSVWLGPGYIQRPHQ